MIRPRDSATEHTATYIVPFMFTNSGHLRPTLVVTPLLRDDVPGDKRTMG